MNSAGDGLRIRVRRRVLSGWSQPSPKILAIGAAAQPSVSDEIVEHDLASARPQTEEPCSLFEPEGQTGHFLITAEDTRDQLGAAGLAVHAVARAMTPFRCPESEPHAWANALTMPETEPRAGCERGQSPSPGSEPELGVRARGRSQSPSRGSEPEPEVRAARRPGRARRMPSPLPESSLASDSPAAALDTS